MRRTITLPLSLLLIAISAIASAQSTTSPAPSVTVEGPINRLMDYLATRYFSDGTSVKAAAGAEQAMMTAKAVSKLNETSSQDRVNELRIDQQNGASPGATSSTSITEK